MTLDIVQRTREALAGITPGTWEADLDPTGSTRGIWPTEPNEEIIIGAYVAADGFESQDYVLGTDENLRFIAAAPDLVRELLAEVEDLEADRDTGYRNRMAEHELRAQRDKARAIVQRVRRIADDLDAGGCVSCGSIGGGTTIADSLRNALGEKDRA